MINVRFCLNWVLHPTDGSIPLQLSLSIHCLCFLLFPFSQCLKNCLNASTLFTSDAWDQTESYANGYKAPLWLFPGWTECVGIQNTHIFNTLQIVSPSGLRFIRWRKHMNNELCLRIILRAVCNDLLGCTECALWLSHCAIGSNRLWDRKSNSCHRHWQECKLMIILLYLNHRLSNWNDPVVAYSKRVFMTYGCPVFLSNQINWTAIHYAFCCVKGSTEWIYLFWITFVRIYTELHSWSFLCNVPVYQHVLLFTIPAWYNLHIKEYGISKDLIMHEICFIQLIHWVWGKYMHYISLLLLHAMHMHPLVSSAPFLLQVESVSKIYQITHNYF